MAKFKRSIIAALACIMMIALGAFAFAACGGSNDYTVTFMVREGGATGEWREYATADTNDDGAVTLPAEPTVEGYTFRDWYTDEACTEVFDENKVTADINVYALMVETEVTLYVTDGGGNTAALASGSFATLSETTAAQEKAAAAENLTFDGWYTDANCTQSYTAGMDATSLYARYMAEVTFDNGYEVLYTELVVPDGKTAAPDGRVDGFVKRYMDDEDISYADADGNAIDFSKYAFGANEVITVLWKTPGLNYKKIDGTGSDYYVSGIDGDNALLESYPAVSVLSKNVTMDDGSVGNVIGVAAYGLGYCSSSEIFIFNEGIESIQEFYTGSFLGSSVMKKVDLPSTLKVLEDSFNMIGNDLSELILPEGLEVIIDCFWTDAYIAENTYRENGMSITITVPSTVTNMVAVPKNLDLSKNKNFQYDKEGRLYYISADSKSIILCSEYQSHVTDGRLVVEEGVTGVQVYLLSTMDFDYLDLPSTFCEVGYNNAAENYPSYTGNLLTPQSVINNPTTAPGGANKYSYAIVSNLEELVYVSIDLNSMPEGVSDYAFVSTQGVPHNGQAFANDVKVVFTGAVPQGQGVVITLTVSFSRDNEVTTQKLTGYKSGDTITSAQILEAAGVSEEDYNVVINNVGKEYGGGVIDSDMYITVECYSKPGGFTYKVNADGKTATVTGVDIATAEQLTDGSYRVVIDMIDGYEVTAIEAGKFKGENRVSEVYISNTVTEIGAEAFMNMPLLRLVDIAPGGLSVIGKSAFENAGCVQDAEGNWIVNTDGGVKELTMKLPLADLTDIQPYAFKTKALKKFTPVEGEKNRYILQNLATAMAGTYVSTDLVEGKFYWAYSMTNEYYEIVQYVKQSTEQASDGESITMIDARLIAIAGGDTSTGFNVNIGISYRGAPFATYYPILKNAVVRFEVMTGSVYFVSRPVEFGVVSKVHENAFTDMNNNTIYWYGPEGDTWLLQEDLQQQNSEIFEDGWWEGISNAENTKTSDVGMDSNTILGQ